MANSAAATPGVVAETWNGGEDVLMILGYTSWAGAARRHRIHPEDQLTVKLMESPRVSRLLVCNPYRSLPAKLLRRPGAAAEAFPKTSGRHLTEPTRLRRTDSTRPAAIARASARYERSVRKVAESLGMRRPAVITAHPLLAGFCDFEWAGPVTYYANDDLTAYPVLEPWWPAFEESFAMMRARGRRAVGLTPKSLQSVDPSGPGAVVPTGLIPDEWAAPGEAPEWFMELPGPRMVYVGTLDERIDPAFIRQLAESQPDGSVVMIGRGGDEGPLTDLRHLPNLHVRAPIPRKELVDLIAAADLGLVPHVRTDQTRAMSPLKLYEYLGGGIPVAATDLPGVAPVCPDRVRLATDAAEFPAAAAAALELGHWDESSRQEFVFANSWGTRFESLLDLAFAPEGQNGQG